MKKVLFLLVPLLSACFVFGFSKVPFSSSSLDFNSGVPQELAVRETRLLAVAQRFIVLAKERGYFLISKECSDVDCRMQFKYVNELNRQITFGSGGGASYDGYGSSSMSVSTSSLNKGSKLIAELEVDNKTVFIKAFGFAVLNQHDSCPQYYSLKIKKCSPANLMARWGDLNETVRSDWGFDVSGQSEFDTINGIFAELKS